MYDEIVAKKSQNEVISLIHYYFKHLLKPGIKKIYIFTDNCSAQNKNNALFQYLNTIVKFKMFDIEHIIRIEIQNPVTVSYLVTGVLVL